MTGIVFGVFFCGFLFGVLLMALLAISKGREPYSLQRDDRKEEGMIWHLTPRGWIPESAAFPLRENRGIPSDRVLSCFVETKGAFGRMPGSLVEIWRCSDAETVSELIARFGEAPPRAVDCPDLFAGDSASPASRHL